MALAAMSLRSMWIMTTLLMMLFFTQLAGASPVLANGDPDSSNAVKIAANHPYLSKQMGDSRIDINSSSSMKPQFYRELHPRTHMDFIPSEIPTATIPVELIEVQTTMFLTLYTTLPFGATQAPTATAIDSDNDANNGNNDSTGNSSNVEYASTTTVVVEARPTNSTSVISSVTEDAASLPTASSVAKPSTVVPVDQANPSGISGSDVLDDDSEPEATKGVPGGKLIGIIAGSVAGALFLILLIGTLNQKRKKLMKKRRQRHAMRDLENNAVIGGGYSGSGGLGRVGGIGQSFGGPNHNFNDTQQHQQSPINGSEMEMSSVGNNSNSGTHSEVEDNDSHDTPPDYESQFYRDIVPPMRRPEDDEDQISRIGDYDPPEVLPSSNVPRNEYITYSPPSIHAQDSDKPNAGSHHEVDELVSEPDKSETNETKMVYTGGDENLITMAPASHSNTPNNVQLNGQGTESAPSSTIRPVQDDPEYDFEDQPPFITYSPPASLCSTPRAESPDDGSSVVPTPTRPRRAPSAEVDENFNRFVANAQALNIQPQPVAPGVDANGMDAHQRFVAEALEILTASRSVSGSSSYQAALPPSPASDVSFAPGDDDALPVPDPEVARAAADRSRVEFPVWAGINGANGERSDSTASSSRTFSGDETIQRLASRNRAFLRSRPDSTSSADESFAPQVNGHATGSEDEDEAESDTNGYPETLSNGINGYAVALPNGINGNTLPSPAAETNSIPSIWQMNERLHTTTVQHGLVRNCSIPHSLRAFGATYHRRNRDSDATITVNGYHYDDGNDTDDDIPHVDDLEARQRDHVSAAQTSHTPSEISEQEETHSARATVPFLSPFPSPTNDSDETDGADETPTRSQHAGNHSSDGIFDSIFRPELHGRHPPPSPEESPVARRPNNGISSFTRPNPFARSTVLPSPSSRFLQPGFTTLFDRDPLSGEIADVDEDDGVSDSEYTTAAEDSDFDDATDADFHSITEPATRDSFFSDTTMSDASEYDHDLDAELSAFEERMAAGQSASSSAGFSGDGIIGAETDACKTVTVFADVAAGDIGLLTRALTHGAVEDGTEDDDITETASFESYPTQSSLRSAFDSPSGTINNTSVHADVSPTDTPTRSFSFTAFTAPSRTISNALQASTNTASRAVGSLVEKFETLVARNHGA